MSEPEERKVAAPTEVKEQSVVPRTQPVIRFADGQAVSPDYEPRKERFADGKPIEGAATVQSARTYAKYTDTVHGVGQVALTPFIGDTGAKAVRGVLEGLEGLITSAATKRS